MSEEENIPEEKVPEVNENKPPEENIQPITHNEENMEVHKHPHHVTHKKKWAEYLLEFLMIFLAVFLGYSAENIREHILDRNRGKQYLDAYKNDLLQNQVTYKYYDSLFTELLPVYDSIASIYHGKNENTELQRLSSLLVKGKRTITVPLSTTNYSQLVNSGSLRLIENKAITIAMSKYNDDIISFKEYDVQIKGVRSNLYSEVLKIEDLHDFFSFDKNGNAINDYVPQIDNFPVLSSEQRRVLTNYYKLYIAQTRAELKSLRNLLQANNELLELINKN